MDLTLVIMAAGIGSRFGGIKQIEPVGPNGEMIIDYSVYDAKRAGFNKIVFVIKKEIEEQFREKVFDRLSKQIDCACVFQDMNNLPFDLICPDGREKPWGTAHAVLSARPAVDSPFAVINADDFYGFGAFRIIADYLKGIGANEKYNYCMAGYKLGNTLSEKGYVSRGVCDTNDCDDLVSVVERTKIEKSNGMIYFTEGEETGALSPDTLVSMNCWGFTTDFFDEIEAMFPHFYASNKNNLLKAEFYLPSVVGKLLEEKRASVKVLKCNERWYGFTYKDDKEIVVNEINKMIAENKYPKSLWA